MTACFSSSSYSNSGGERSYHDVPTDGRGKPIKGRTDRFPLQLLLLLGAAAMTTCFSSSSYSNSGGERRDHDGRTDGRGKPIKGRTDLFPLQPLLLLGAAAMTTCFSSSSYSNSGGARFAHQVHRYVMRRTASMSSSNSCFQVQSFMKQICLCVLCI
jgi:hypothetical protein